MSELRNPRNIAKMVNKYQNKKQLVENSACFGLSEQEQKTVENREVFKTIKQDHDIVYFSIPGETTITIDAGNPESWLDVTPTTKEDNERPYLAKCANCGETETAVHRYNFDPKLHHCRDCIAYFKQVIDYNKR